MLPVVSIVVVSILLLVPVAYAASPVANFSATPTSGFAPLTVHFIDASSGTPKGWAWYFGDENFNKTWRLVNASAAWTARDYHSTVAMPDGSIILMGGVNGNLKNDVWRSTDKGKMWTLVNASAGWSARYRFNSVVMPDGSIVLIGGFGSFTTSDDVWRSTDNGVTWIRQTASAEWAPRGAQSSVAMPDGSIILTGGYDGNTDLMVNDVWRSTDNGESWTLENASAGWSGREYHTMVVMPDGSIVLMGGGDMDIGYRNDVWRSADAGATWSLVNASTGWPERDEHCSVVMPDGSIVVMGGGPFVRNDVWRSADYGATWTQLPDAGWTARYGHSCVVVSDGSIVLTGGMEENPMLAQLNDVWRFQPAGSLMQNPYHTYTDPGNYSVALQVYNADGYNNTRKTSYITVMEYSVPVAGFSGTPLTGTAPLSVTFTDTSSGPPALWNWSFGDDQWFNTTTSSASSPIHTYIRAGTYTVNLTVHNSAGTNATSKEGYITVPPVTTPATAMTEQVETDGSDDGLPASTKLLPSTTSDVNVGGYSAISQAKVTGTGISGLIITGTILYGPGYNISPPQGIIYQYIDLVPARYTSIDSTVITFTIPVSWLEEHHLSPQDIRMFHNTGTAWETLPTTTGITANGYVSFTAKSPVFSLFAIGGIPQVKNTVTGSSQVKSFGNEKATSSPIPATQASAVRQPTSSAPPVPAQPSTGLPYMTVALFSAGCVVLAGSGYLIRRWWIHRQNPALFKKYD